MSLLGPFGQVKWSQLAVASQQQLHTVVHCGHCWSSASHLCTCLLWALPGPDPAILVILPPTFNHPSFLSIFRPKVLGARALEFTLDPPCAEGVVLKTIHQVLSDCQGPEKPVWQDQLALAVFVQSQGQGDWRPWRLGHVWLPSRVALSPAPLWPGA